MFKTKGHYRVVLPRFQNESRCMRNLSYENVFDLNENELASKTHFHMKGLAPGLVLKQRQKATRKWPY